MLADLIANGATDTNLRGGCWRFNIIVCQGCAGCAQVILDCAAAAVRTGNTSRRLKCFYLRVKCYLLLSTATAPSSVAHLRSPDSAVQHAGTVKRIPMASGGCLNATRQLIYELQSVLGAGDGSGSPLCLPRRQQWPIDPLQLSHPQGTSM